MTIISVDAPHFNAALIVERDYVIDAAPILRWAIGKPWDEVKAYFARKRWTWQWRRDDGAWSQSVA